MKLYAAVLSYDYEGDYVVGIFSSHELAEKYLKENYPNSIIDRSVVEWTLDVGE